MMDPKALLNAGLRDGGAADLLGDGIPRIRPGLLRSRRLSAQTMGAGAAGATLISTWALEGEFDLVRFIYENDTATPYTVDKIIAAPTALADGNIAGNWLPVDRFGTTQAWTTVTANDAGALDRLPHQNASGSTLTLTVPALTSPAPKGYAATDWARISSITPADGGPMRYITTRSYCVNAGRVLPYSATAVAAFNAADVAQGRTVYFGMRNGDQSAGGTINALNNSQWLAPQSVQFFARQRGLTVLNIGDSISQGTGSIENVAGWGHLACAGLSTPGRRISFCNAGWSGQTSANFYARGMAEIDLFKPEVAVIAIFSPNDGTPTQATVNASWGRAMELAHYALQKGIVPILKTPIPWNTTTETTDGFRRQLVDRARAIAASGAMLVFDADAALSDGATPTRMLVGTNFDAIHPNDDGHALMAVNFLPALRAAIGV